MRAARCSALLWRRCLSPAYQAPVTRRRYRSASDSWERLSRSTTLIIAFLPNDLSPGMLTASPEQPARKVRQERRANLEIPVQPVRKDLRVQWDRREL